MELEQPHNKLVSPSIPQSSAVEFSETSVHVSASAQPPPQSKSNNLQQDSFGPTHSVAPAHLTYHASNTGTTSTFRQHALQLVQNHEVVVHASSALDLGTQEQTLLGDTQAHIPNTVEPAQEHTCLTGQ